MTDDKIKTYFKDEKTLEMALTHKSWVNEHKGGTRSNERLEFLGDAILEFVVSDHIYNKFPDKEEGFLTALRANLVNTQNLSQIAKKLNLGKILYLSKGEEDTGGRTNNSILADLVEAIIGGIFVDNGFEKAKEFISTYLISDIDKVLAEPLKDSKSLLQEKVQAKGYPAPKYEVVKEEGPDHDKKFTIQVLVDGQKAAVGTGKNKSEGAQNAAKKALEKLS